MSIFKLKISRKISLIVFAVAVAAMAALAGGFLLLENNSSYPDFKNSVFSQLKKAREEKITQALGFLEQQTVVARDISSTPQFLDYFTRTIKFFQRKAYGSASFKAQDRNWEELYAKSLGMFYDLLLLDLEGNIFYSVKKEQDFLKNISDPMFDGLALSKGFSALGNEPDFIEYEFYAVSNEPASFYLVPVFHQSKKIGTAVFQLAINKVNGIFTNREGLGRTGEVYIVNQKKLMLTDSRFIQDPTHFKLAIDTTAIREALQVGEGEKIILDYRGKSVFSSFQSFQFGNTRWVIIAEKDESEVLTDFYEEFADELHAPMFKALSAITLLMKPPKEPLPTTKEKTFVDLQEIARTSNGNLLYTLGVSTCTAVSASLPGRVNYLAHLTPTDAAYGLSWPASQMLGQAHTDLLGEMLGRLYWFDVYPSQRDLLRFGVYATQDEGLAAILRELVERGVTLAQIKVVYQPSFDSVSVSMAPPGGETRLRLQHYESNRVLLTDMEGMPSLETVLKQVVGG